MGVKCECIGEKFRIWAKGFTFVEKGYVIVFKL